MKRLFLFVLIVFSATKTQGHCSGLITGNRCELKTNSNWFFTNGVFVNFPNESGTTIFSNTASRLDQRLSYEASTTISDDNGDLLYYTNGRRLWNTAGSLIYSGLLARNQDLRVNSNTSIQGVTSVTHKGLLNLYLPPYCGLPISISTNGTGVCSGKGSLSIDLRTEYNSKVAFALIKRFISIESITVGGNNPCETKKKYNRS